MFANFQVLVVMIQCAVVLLAQCALRAPDTTTYQAVLYHYVGTWAGIAADIIIVIANFGTCMTYLVIIADQLDKSKYTVQFISFDFLLVFNVMKRISTQWCGEWKYQSFNTANQLHLRIFWANMKWYVLPWNCWSIVSHSTHRRYHAKRALSAMHKHSW